MAYYLENKVLDSDEKFARLGLKSLGIGRIRKVREQDGIWYLEFGRRVSKKVGSYYFCLSRTSLDRLMEEIGAAVPRDLIEREVEYYSSQENRLVAISPRRF